MRTLLFKRSFAAFCVLYMAMVLTAYWTGSPFRLYIAGGGAVMLVAYAFRVIRTRYDLWELRLEPNTISIFAGESPRSVRCRAKMDRSQVVEIRESGSNLFLHSRSYPYRLSIPSGVEDYSQLKATLEQWRAGRSW